ncbi:SDR family NAD(P)-dependent oxidoreductase [Pelagicoccus mobilis]|uniref:SDR family oxidoreductase n=1 Tax=Pelagicoccus mobilis TaxID=415221 RepID=A0A934VML4_9BACT|nr:SDR family oxidoreductase [Pelagicoccus mobilis]MBK1878976.1 SDR family oxidoreductase [Pelagicoccus mobilis]
MSEKKNSDLFCLEGEIALVTGGGTGIGLAIAQSLIDAGAKVCISGRRADVLKEAVASLGDTAIACEGDVTKAEDRGRMLKDVQKAFGAPVSILVNNAGQNFKKPALELSDEEFDQLLDTHVKAGFALSRDVAPAMIEKGKGSIVFIASMASYMGVPQIIGYTTAKTAVVGLTRGLAAEWSKQGIRVNAIAPGWISTPMTDRAFAGDPVRKEKVLSRTPIGTMGLPEDIGQAAVYLCSDAAKFVTGQCVPVDGGASIGF